MSTTQYSLSDTEFLVFKTFKDHLEIFSGHDGSADRTKIANFVNGKWVFDDYNQRKLFFFLFSIYKKKFYHAIKFYNHSLIERPKTYVFTCAKRRISIKITKLRNKMFDSIYNTFYGR